ncbi:hypothetical protein WSM22_38590 [Cytophagales bacterium WSM2-2]|nr:hypothetical protein WSM22_38590 [Cytophagales bacterium WSM2-2]
MNDSNWFTLIGLVFDIVGALLLFKYGLPSKVKEMGSAFGGGPEADEEEKERLAYNRKIEIMANTGLVLLILGFVLQFIANLPFASCSNIFPK